MGEEAQSLLESDSWKDESESARTAILFHAFCLLFVCLVILETPTDSTDLKPGGEQKGDPRTAFGTLMRFGLSDLREVCLQGSSFSFCFQVLAESRGAPV